MAYDLATVTNSGNQLLASVVSDRSSLVIDKIEVSGTQLASSTDLKSMTSISNVVQTLSANGYQKKDSSFIISTVLDNSSVKVDYQAWVFGIWAHETGVGSPILMSVITSTNSPDTISKGSGTPIDYNYKFVTTFSNTSSLTIQMSSDTYATNDTVLHNSGDETATGTKTFQKIKISNDKFPALVQTDGQYITLDGGNSELIPANDSKVVHTADMRKPASDVAGIDEVNTKQDKIGYTPADDSKVVHTTDTSGWQKQAMFNPGDYKIDQASSDTDFVTLLRTKYNKAGIVYIRSAGPFIDAVVTCEGDSWWYAYGVTADGYFVHRRIRESDDTGWIINADDSKVAHLSGANNFDTVPMVNNNPLLLASSLPSDLARTSANQEYTGKNTFDIAPIDKTTGHPYITKDGVPNLPPDIARTGQAQTFTAAQTFSIAPTIKDASKDKGDNQAATMADLKSVEKSAWRVANTYEASKHLFNPEVIYRVDSENKKIYLYGGGISGVSSDTNQFKFLDFSDISKNISIDSSTIFVFGDNESPTVKIINGVVYLTFPQDIAYNNFKFTVEGTRSNDRLSHIWGILNYS